MAVIRRVPVVWQTGAGGAGVSNFYSASADDATASLGTFFNAIKALFPAAVSWQIPSSGDTLEATTGELTGAWSGGTAATIASSGSGTYAAGTGAYVRWYTGAVRSGRKFIGRTFLCPVLSAVYDNDGTLTSGNVTIIQNAATALAGTGLIGIWGRALDDPPTNGIFMSVTSGVCPDKVTSLRTRRS